MSIFKFYEVDKDYVDFLKQVENKIPNISYERNDKFLCGILFSINGMNYYAPISSFNQQQRTNILIKNEEGKILSSIRLSFMFPVPDHFATVKDFKKEVPAYKRLLMEELEFCNKNAEKIISKAQYIYDSVVNGPNDLMQKNCCDFIKLEKQYLAFCSIHNIPIPAKAHRGTTQAEEDEYDMEI